MERHGIRWPHRDAIDTLFDPQTGVLLYYRQELPSNDSSPFKHSEGTIKSHLCNARLHLQECPTPYLKKSRHPLTRVIHYTSKKIRGIQFVFSLFKKAQTC